MTKDDLIAFEADVAAVFERGEIRAPIHLSGGNEEHLLRIFQDVQSGDWVISTWRSHYHALLHGVPPSEVMDAICAGRSISLCFPRCRFLASGIVAGAVPIALGIAMGLKLKQQDTLTNAFAAATQNPNLEIKGSIESAHVWCFVGDMCARTGAFYETREYAIGHDLPITFVIEDNGKSVLTDTTITWSNPPWWDDYGGIITNGVEYHLEDKFVIYHYKLKWPHSGTGKRVQFSF